MSNSFKLGPKNFPGVLPPLLTGLALPTFLLCVPFKILEGLIYARCRTNYRPLLRLDQTSLRHKSSTVDQVTLLADARH